MPWTKTKVQCFEVSNAVASHLRGGAVSEPPPRRPHLRTQASGVVRCPSTQRQQQGYATATESSMESSTDSNASLSGRERRRFGKQKQCRTIARLKAQVQQLQSDNIRQFTDLTAQITVMKGIILQQQAELDAMEPAKPASPVLFDAYDISDARVDAATQTDNCDKDFSTQTEMSLPHSVANRYFCIGSDGLPVPCSSEAYASLAGIPHATQSGPFSHAQPLNISGSKRSSGYESAIADCTSHRDTLDLKGMGNVMPTFPDAVAEVGIACPPGHAEASNAQEQRTIASPCSASYMLLPQDTAKHNIDFDLAPAASQAPEVHSSLLTSEHISPYKSVKTKTVFESLEQCDDKLGITQSGHSASVDSASFISQEFAIQSGSLPSWDTSSRTFGQSPDFNSKLHDFANQFGPSASSSTQLHSGHLDSEPQGHKDGCISLCHALSETEATQVLSALLDGRKSSDANASSDYPWFMPVSSPPLPALPLFVPTDAHDVNDTSSNGSHGKADADPVDVDEMKAAMQETHTVPVQPTIALDITPQPEVLQLLRTLHALRHTSYAKVIAPFVQAAANVRNVTALNALIAEHHCLLEDVISGAMQQGLLPTSLP